MQTTSQLLSAILQFIYYYPLFMAYVWIIGSLYFYVKWERGRNAAVGQMPEAPGVSIIVPCHNEGPNIEETIRYAAKQEYPNFEIIAVNDGSTDDTGAILDRLSGIYPQLRVIHLAANQGKAMALRMGAVASANEYLVCIDGDALLDAHAVGWTVRHFVSGPRVGAVTGNPRVRTRSTLLGKIQVGEFSAIVGMIKRSQRIYGRIFTVSGVVAGFRKAALHDVGYWSTDMVTEDIDISWNLQLHGWQIRFEPNALCWILMPETLRGLWRQRLRWAQGGVEVILKYLPRMWRWRSRRMWLLYVEFLVSLLWAHAVAGVVLLWLLTSLGVPLPTAVAVSSLLPGWTSVALIVTCLVQFSISLAIDARYEKGVSKYYYWMIWYPLAYWLINVFTTVCALPRALVKRRGTRAIWVSPDRGVRP